MKNALKSLSLILLLIACVNKNITEERLSVGHYGHLARMNQYGKTEAYLIYFPPKKTYNVCISELAVRKYKGIKAEIEASINIWGHYIGRKIPVKFTEVNLPYFSQSDSHNYKRKSVQKFCPKNTHLMFGLEDSFLNRKAGVTSFKAKEVFNYDKGKIETESFARWIFVTDSGNYNFSKGLVTLEELTGQKRSADEILKLLIERKTTLFGNSLLSVHSLPLIIHEIGHVWGMCDQYDIGEGKTNCDPHNSSHDEFGRHVLVEDSVMNSAFPITKSYLTDDDILGIKKLASRSDQEKVKWPNEHLAPIRGKKVADESNNHFFRVDKVKLEEGRLDLSLSLYSKKAFKLKVYRSYNIEDQGVTYTNFEDIHESEYPSGSEQFISWDTKRGTEAFRQISFNGVYLYDDEKVFVSIERGSDEVTILEYSNKNSFVKRNFENMTIKK